MQTSKTVWVALIAVAIIAIGGYFFPQVKGVFGGVQTGTDITTTNLTTLSVANGLAVGGVFTTAARQTLVAATTTPCAIQSPNATSTIQSFVMNVTTSTSTAITFAIGTSTTAYATSTSMVATAALAAGAQGTLGFSPNGSNVGVISPSTWIVVGNATGQVFYPSAVGGTCQAVFQIAS